MRWGKIHLKENHPRNVCNSQNFLVQVQAALRGVSFMSLEFLRRMRQREKQIKCHIISFMCGI